MSNKVYEIVTGQIIEKLKAGEIPWRKPWAGGLPINYVSRKPYTGINLMLLPGGGEFLTWNQVQKLGGHVKKGSKSLIVVFFKMLENEDGEKRIPYLRYYRVFKLEDVEGIPSKLEIIEHDPIEACEKVAGEFTEVPVKHDNSSRAYYTPSGDFVNVPGLDCFPIREEYYSTLFHELVHSTGHPARLNRFEAGPGATAEKFGSEKYSFEELVAELGAGMLCGVCGIESRTLDNSTAYVQGWLKTLQNDKTMIVKAASKAQKAADYIQGIKKEEEKEEAEQAS